MRLRGGVGPPRSRCPPFASSTPGDFLSSCELVSDARGGLAPGLLGPRSLKPGWGFRVKEDRGTGVTSALPSGAAARLALLPTSLAGFSHRRVVTAGFS